MNVELKGVDKVLAALNPKIYEKALNRTINEMGSKMTTQMVKDARKTYNIKASDLKEFIKVSKSRYDNLKYVIDVRSRRFNAMRFSPKRLKKKGNVSVRIKKDSGRKTLKRAFFAKNGAVLYRGKTSQEIKAITTVSIPQMFNKKIIEDANKMVEKETRKTLKRNFNFYIGKV